MCPAWTGFSLENEGTEAGCVRCTVKLLCCSIRMGPRGVTGVGLPCVHPLRLILAALAGSGVLVLSA